MRYMGLPEKSLQSSCFLAHRKQVANVCIFIGFYAPVLSVVTLSKIIVT